MLLVPGSGQQDAILDWTRRRVGDSQRPPVQVSLPCVSKIRQRRAVKQRTARDTGAEGWKLAGWLEAGSFLGRSVLGSWMMDVHGSAALWKRDPAPRGHLQIGWGLGVGAGVLGCWGTRVWGDVQLPSRLACPLQQHDIDGCRRPKEQCAQLLHSPGGVGGMGACPGPRVHDAVQK